MSTSNLKPSKYELESNLEQYRVDSGSHLSDLEFEVIHTVCQKADRAMRLAARKALAQVDGALKGNFFPRLTPDRSALPMATQIDGGEAYRISIPISFVGRLLEVTPTRGGMPPKEASDYFLSSTIVALLAAYGHEINHIFVGHLKTPSSLGQETHADFIGGALLWAWIDDDEIAELCQIEADVKSAMCAYGFLHLVSVLSDSDHDISLYLPRCLRLAVFAGGAGFYAGRTQGSFVGHSVQQAFDALPRCPRSDFESQAIRSQHVTLTDQLKQPHMLAKLRKAFEELSKEKSGWYISSEHLRQIKRDLNRARR